MTNILKQQLTILQEMRKRLSALMTDTLEENFSTNEVILLSLLEKENISADDLKQLDAGWEVLNNRIASSVDDLKNTISERKTSSAPISQASNSLPTGIS